MKVLITDLMFPNRYSQWRNVEILSFIEKYDTDILVYKTEIFAGIRFDFDYKHSIFFESLKDYNILIFDSRFNHLNEFNTRIDGTKFNNLCSGSYLLTKKNYFDADNYDIVYHIFLGLYNQFNKDYRVNSSKQAIHLYPGGGLANSQNINEIDKEVRLVITHPDVVDWAKDRKYIKAFMAPLLMKNQSISHNNQKSRLGICFASLGHGHAKGDQYYIKIAQIYKQSFPQDQIDFYSIGNCSRSNLITHKNPMDYVSLSNFYHDYIDVYLNLETGTDFNGWPLGIEAAIQGSVIITTDTRNSSQKFAVSNNTFFVSHDILEIVKQIKLFHDDRNLLQEYSKNTKSFLEKIISYESQQKRIFKFLEEIYVDQITQL